MPDTCCAPYLRDSAPSANPSGVSPARKLPSSPERLPLTTDRRVLTVDPAGWLKKAIASSEISVPSPKRLIGTQPFAGRSEEHTSELQSLMRISYAVFCLKKKKITTTKHTIQSSNNNIQM